MDRGIGMDALITAGPQDIGDGAITIDTGVTATTTRETGITVNSGLKNLSPSTCVKVSPALRTLFVGSPGQLLTLDAQERAAEALESSTSGKSGSHLNSELRKSSPAARRGE